MDILLEATTGSRAYGLERPDSDTDTLGAFRAPLEDILGLWWHPSKETVTNASPEGDDTTYYEVGKFIREALKSNPQVNEVLWAEEPRIPRTGGISKIGGMQLIAHRDEFLSFKAVKSTYYNIARNNLETYTNRDRTKNAVHALRFAHQGYELLTTGRLTVRLSDPQSYLDLYEAETGEVLDRVTKALIALNEVTVSPLPETPNKEFGNELAIALRT